MKLLDQVTYDRVEAVVQHCRRHGINIPTRLHEADLLWTPERERLLRADAMRFIAVEMLEWSPAEYLRTVNKKLEAATPTEMYHAIATWIKRHADRAAQGKT
jgi:hypothetical protein